MKTHRKANAVCALLVLALLVSSAVYYKYDDVHAARTDAASGAGQKAQEEVTLTIAYLPITHALPLFEAKSFSRRNTATSRSNL